MGFIQEFKDFAIKGNMVETAIAFVMGGAFGKVSSAFIDGMVMPAVGMLTGGQDFSAMKIILQEAVTDAAGKVTTPEVAISYGAFISTIINFLIVALVMFMIVKAMNNARKAEAEAPAPPPAPTKEETLLGEIRDLLSKR